MQIKNALLLLLLLSISQMSFSQLYPTCEEIGEDVICDSQLLDGWSFQMNEETSNQGPNNECTGDNPHDRTWFAFVAPEGDYFMRFSLTNCSTPFTSIKGAQVTVYNNCDFSDIAYCSPFCTSGNRDIPEDILIAGETYYVLLDGCFGSVCEIEVQLIGQGIESFCFDDEYIPMDTITDWYTAYGGFVSNGTYYYQDIGDTIINGIDYRKIRPEPYENNFQTRYIRENRNERKVYQYSVFSEEESILYDFSLSIGDSFEAYTGTFIVVNIDTVSSTYGPLTRWKLDGPGPFIYYTEAIGSEDLFLGNLSSDPVFNLLCAFHEDEKVYGNDGCMTPPRWVTDSTFIVVDICDGDSYDFNGEILTEMGIYMDTLVNTVGADSIITLELNLLPYSFSNFDVEICEGESIIVNGIIFDEFSPTGTIVIPNGASNGCDSTITVELTFVSGIMEYYQATICEGSYEIWVGDTISMAGEYEFILVSENGCDSIINLSVEVIEDVQVSITETLCDGDIFNIDGIEYTEPGTYQTDYEAVNGCDSVVILNLNFLELSEVFDTVYFCPNDSIEAGVYQIVEGGINGCDSITIITAIELLLSDPECTTNTYNLESFDLKISPNPFDHTIHLTSQERVQSLEVISISGAKMDFIDQINSQNYIYDASQLTAGVYILTIRSIDKIAIRRIVKN